MRISGVRGILLEEIVLYLLEKVGYRIVTAGEPGTRGDYPSLEVQGRGEWHQIDALAAFDHTPAFMFPIRLMVEAKCYGPKKPVGIEIVRNAVGVHKDISENHFTFQPGADQRYNYLSAVFSTSGYTKNAERYALAHQIFLIQYANVGVFQPIIKSLYALKEKHFRQGVLKEKGIGKKLREHFRNIIREYFSHIRDYRSDINVFFRFTDDDSPFRMDAPEFRADTPQLYGEIGHIFESMTKGLNKIQGSYFGMLQGKWPVHLLSEMELPAKLFAEQDGVRCRLDKNSEGHWAFIPSGIYRDSPEWFRLEFDFPDEIASLIWASDAHQGHDFLNLSGVVGGVQRQIQLRFENGLLHHFLWKLRFEASQRDEQR